MRRVSGYRSIGIGNAALLLSLALCLVMAGDAMALKSGRREEARKRIHSVKTWQLSQELELDEQQARTFFPVMESYDNQRERLSEDRAGVESELDSLLSMGGPRADMEILKKLERLKLIDREQTAHEEEYQRELGRILTPQQQARYELFERNFEARLRNMIREIQREEEGSASTKPGRSEKTKNGKPTDTEKKNNGKKLDKSDGSDDSRKSKSRTGDGDKDESGSKKNSDERSSRGKGASRNSGERTTDPSLPRRGEMK